MAVGKNKRVAKKKGRSKKIIDPFARKDWYDIKAPTLFTQHNVGKTPVNRTQGNVIASDSLKGRVIEANLGDLNKNEDWSFVNFRLKVDDIQGRNCLTNFHGMHFTTDKLKYLVRKWQTMIEANTVVKTTDGYLLRVFCVGFTRKRQNQLKKTSYAQSSQIRQIRKKMFEIIAREASSGDLKELIVKLIPNTIGKQIEKECHGIYPLKDVFVNKFKIIKAPKFDAAKLLELHGEGSGAAAAAAAAAASAAAAAASADAGAKVDRA